MYISKDHQRLVFIICILTYIHSILIRGSRCGVVANVLVCDIEVSEGKFQSCYDVHILTNILKLGVNFFISPATGWIVPWLYVYKDSYGTDNLQR